MAVIQLPSKHLLMDGIVSLVPQFQSTSIQHSNSAQQRKTKMQTKNHDGYFRTNSFFCNTCKTD